MNSSSVSRKMYRALKSWSDYFDELSRISDTDDPLTKARESFHRERLEATRDAIAEYENETSPGGHLFHNGVCECGQETTDDPDRCHRDTARIRTV